MSEPSARIVTDPSPSAASATRAALAAIVAAIRALPSDAPLHGTALDPILRRHPRDGRGFFSRSELIAGLRDPAVRSAGGLGSAEAEALVRRLQLRPVRSRSGVTPLTVLTQPFPCPGRCIFCPNDVRMPKSYLSAEPGAQRAADHRFDPYLQTWSRLAAYRAIGHPWDKVELIVLGGTWSAYPEAYQVWFVARCLEALNDFGASRDRRPAEPASDFTALPGDVHSGAGGGYNRWTADFVARQGEPVLSSGSERHADWPRLADAQRRNETAGSRCVGLSLETRPDRVDADEVARLRRLGATKIQLGIQSLSDAVLAANRRGHDVAASRTAVTLLRRAGFKLHAHWMPNLLGSSPARDAADFARLFDDPAIRPDELKIYPCSLVESADLMEPWRRGEWRPYERDELLEVLTSALVRVPRWCRVTRVIRDISSDDIVVGNKLTNFRELAEAELARRGLRSRDIRSREIRDGRFDEDALRLRETGYGTGAGCEVFLELTTPDDRIVAFLRLALPSGPAPGVLADELGDHAVIRELHVYGRSLRLGAEAGEDAQHRGLGRRLVEAACVRARADGRRAIAVISAVGTRGYYRRLGFRDGDAYQHRALAP